jgi:hypothetical protein
MFCAHLLKTTLKELSKRLRGNAWNTPSVITQNGQLITSKPANEIVARDLVVLCFQNAPFKPGLLPNIYFASAQRDGRCMARAFPHEFRMVCGDGLEQLGADIVPLVW